jgi:hypothetical protein
MMSPNTDIIIAKVKRYILIASVRLLSMTSTSRENRFVMRPRGVVSKKDIGALRARVIAVFSILLLAVVPMMVSERAKKNSKSA